MFRYHDIIVGGALISSRFPLCLCILSSRRLRRPFSFGSASSSSSSCLRRSQCWRADDRNKRSFFCLVETFQINKKEAIGMKVQQRHLHSIYYLCLCCFRLWTPTKHFWATWSNQLTYLGADSVAAAANRSNMRVQVQSVAFVWMPFLWLEFVPEPPIYRCRNPPRGPTKRRHRSLCVPTIRSIVQ